MKYKLLAALHLTIAIVLAVGVAFTCAAIDADRRTYLPELIGILYMVISQIWWLPINRSGVDS